MKNTKNLLVIVAMMLLVAMVSVAGTVAWLTAQTNIVSNTFTVGKCFFRHYDWHWSGRSAGKRIW